MRKILFFALVLFSAVSFSQAPQFLNYQAIARNASGTIVTTPIGIKFEILQGSASGTLVYEETHNINPSSAGVFTAAIGNGSNVVGNFTTINWANSPYFIRVSIDPAGGTSYSTVGTSQLLSVPYALYAETAGNAQTFTAGNGITINSGTITNSAPNQTVNISGPDVSGTYPNYTITPGTAPIAGNGISIISGTITNTAPDQTVTISGAIGTYPNFTVTSTPPTTITPGNSNISVVGSDPNFTISSVPSLTVVGNQLSISNGNTVTLPTGTTYTNGAGIAFTTGTVITNTAPDQTVTIGNGTNVIVNGTYPNFTVNAVPTLSIAANVLSISGGNSVVLPSPPTPTAGPGISIVSGTISNTAPNQTVNVSGAGVSGTYPNYTITSAAATSVAAGNNISVAGTAPSYTVSSPTYTLNFANSSTGNLTNGISNTSVSLPQPTLTLSGVNSNIISAGSNSITVPHYYAGSGLVLSGTSPNFTLGTTSTGTNTGWSTLGNNGTVDGTNYIGTNDNIPFNIKVNNQKAGRIDHLLANTFFGYQAGNANTTGTFNVAFGNQTMLSNTNGSYNTALGVNALYFNTTGSNNNASGYQAMYSNTTGNYNTASGQQALYNNTSGFQNTASGYQSQFSNTTGNDNNSFGFSSLRSNTSGVRNVAVGNYALNFNTSGSQNTAVGHGALYSQSYNPGIWNSDNVAIGMQALYSNQPTSSTNGYQNTAVGTSALQNNTIGYQNTVLGYQSLFSNATGNNNVVLGSFAGYNATGSGNVFLGHQAGFSETGSDKLYIANSSAAVPLIYGDFSSGNVGLGTTTPSSRLHVKSNGSGYIIHENTLGGTNPYGMMFTAPGQDWYFLANSGTGPANSLGIFDGTGSAMRMIFMPTNGFVGVGTTAPASLFHVNGQITITDGTQGANKMLTSSTSGTGSWVGAPGVEMNGIIVTNMNLTANTDLTSIAVTVPGPGYVVVTFDGYSASTPAGNHIILAVSNTSATWGANNGHVSAQNTGNSACDIAFSHTQTYGVAAAGTYTYYAVGRLWTGVGLCSIYGNITARYFPYKY